MSDWVVGCAALPVRLTACVCVRCVSACMCVCWQMAKLLAERLHAELSASLSTRLRDSVKDMVRAMQCNAAVPVQPGSSAVVVKHRSPSIALS